MKTIKSLVFMVVLLLVGYINVDAKVEPPGQVYENVYIFADFEEFVVAGIDVQYPLLELNQAKLRSEKVFVVSYLLVEKSAIVDAELDELIISNKEEENTVTWKSNSACQSETYKLRPQFGTKLNLKAALVLRC